MKKLSKKKRNELRNKEEVKSNVSKNKELEQWKVQRRSENKKRLTEKKENRVRPLIIRECYHYEGSGGGFVAGFAYTTLKPTLNGKCKCEVCQKEFPIEFMRKMEMLVREYANAGCCEVIDAGMRLMNEAQPVKYYLVGRKEVHYVDESFEKDD